MEAALEDLLNRLLEAERAGHTLLDTLSQTSVDSGLTSLFASFTEVEVSDVSILEGLIRLHGGTPSTATGDFAQKVLQVENLQDHLTSSHAVRRGSLAQLNKRSIYNLLQISRPFSRRWRIVIDTMWNGHAQKPYESLSNKTTRRLPLLLCGVALVQFLSLEATIPLDAAVYQWLQSGRSCHLVQLGMQCKDSPLWYLIVFGGLGVCVLGLQRRWTDIAHALLIVLSGAFLSELLKTGLDRARPSALPAWLVGNSFPSGHVIGAVLITGTLIFFLARKDVPVWLKLWGSGIALCLSGVIIWQRLYLGHHWVTYVIGSLLIAGTLLSVALRPPAFLQSARRVVCLGLVSLLCYQGFSFGKTAPQEDLSGDWGQHAQEPIGPISWARQGDARMTLTVPQGEGSALQVITRPFVKSKAYTCFPLEIIVNGQFVQRLFLYRGWREYTIPLPNGWIRPGDNTILFRTGEDFPMDGADRRTVAFHSVQLL